jgi:hypothetical protein
LHRAKVNIINLKYADFGRNSYKKDCKKESANTTSVGFGSCDNDMDVPRI